MNGGRIEHLAPHIGNELFGVADIVHLHVALLFHAPILKPDLDCALGQAQLGSQLATARPRYVGLDLELLFQLV